MREIRDLGLELTDTYHSHPRTKAFSSAKDREFAAYPRSLRLIVSLATDDPEVRCYRISEKGSASIAMKILRLPCDWD
ncbi:MAG TPA: Mov34/MPN/PAD-1 family protein [Rubrobacteraceae bacterium]|nr:Mov34/MPN/PAD-1 family protein [Rubrobacteraceae bacterium]